MNKAKQNRSKYNFGTYKVDQEIEVDPLDVHSMLTSLGSFNKRHGRDIVVEPTGVITKEGKVKCLVSKI